MRSQEETSKVALEQGVGGEREALDSGEVERGVHVVDGKFVHLLLTSGSERHRG